MRKLKTAGVISIGILMLLVFCSGCSEAVKWQDHIYSDDPILGDKPGGAVVNWVGEWTLHTWWEQDENGDPVEVYDELYGYAIYNANGTAEFQEEDGDVQEGTYEIIMQVSHDFGDDWWDGPWWVAIDIDGGEMRWFWGDSLLEGPGEGYIFTREDPVDKLILGEWTMTYWWEQDGEGGEEGEDHEGYVIYNTNGTAEFQIFDDPVLEGDYEFKMQVNHDFGDDWWDGPWAMALTLDELRWFTNPDLEGEGEGYIFEKAE